MKIKIEKNPLNFIRKKTIRDETFKTHYITLTPTTLKER